MDENRIWHLLARKFTDEANTDEINELERLLIADPTLRETAEKMQAVWQYHHKDSLHKAINSFARIDQKIKAIKEADQPLSVTDPEDKVIPLYKKYRIAWTVAASLLIIVTAGFFFLNKKEQRPVTNTAVMVPEKHIREIKMPDGTQITVNERSSLEYNDGYNAEIREVWLKGEAYFDVIKSKEKPFIIHSGNVHIRVLGTAFNVKSYPGENKVETSLIRGSVEITTTANPTKKYILKPGQKLILPASEEKPGMSIAQTGFTYGSISKVAESARDSIITEISWTEGKTAFYEMSFSELAKALSHKYNVRFEFHDKTKEKLEFTGVFYRQPISQVIEILSRSAPFSFSIKDSIVHIY